VVLAATLLTHVHSASAADPFVATGHSATQGTPVAGGVLTADLGTWSYPPDPERYEFQWLRDGTPVDGATSRDYQVQPVDVGHQLAPYVVGHHGSESAHFTGSAMTIRKLASSLRVDVRRVHPRPDRHRMVWTAIAFMSTERPWATDGGTVVAYRKKDHRWKELGTTVVARGAAFVRLPWKQAPAGRTKVKACYLGSDVVAASCSPPDVVRRQR
jgi:hypothetical protein